MTESTPELLEEIARRIARACGGCTCGSHLRAAVRMLEDLDDRTMDLLRRRTEALNRVVKEKDELREALVRVLGAAQVAPGATVDPTAIHDAIGGELISALYFPDFQIRFNVHSTPGLPVSSFVVNQERHDG